MFRARQPLHAVSLRSHSFRSTTTPPSARFADWLWAGRITAGRSLVAGHGSRRRSTRSSRPRSSMASIPQSMCTPRSSPRTGALCSCPGSSRMRARPPRRIRHRRRRCSDRCPRSTPVAEQRTQLRNVGHADGPGARRKAAERTAAASRGQDGHRED